MATGCDCNCPICHDALGDMAYVIPCHHQFCLGCIVRWAKRNPTCPLCRQPVQVLIYAMQPSQETLEMVLLQPSGALQAEQEGAGSEPTSYVAGFPAKTWALFFRNYAEVLEPVQLWLNEVLVAPCWWDVALAQGRIISYLCCYGLDEAILVRELEPLLEEQTVSFVHQLFSVVTEHCYERVQMLVEAHRASSAEGHSHMEPGPDANLEGMAASGATAPEEPPEEPGQAVEAASNAECTCAWGCCQEPFR